MPMTPIERERYARMEKDLRERFKLDPAIPLYIIPCDYESDNWMNYTIQRKANKWAVNHTKEVLAKENREEDGE